MVYRKKKSESPDKKEESFDKKQGEVGTADNIKDTSAEKGKEDANYFDPCYDYMGTA